VLVAVLTMLGVVASPSLASPPPSVPGPFFAPVQTLTWTANDSVTQYKSAPTTAVPGETTIVFENSEATGNTSGMTHTLTFDTSTPGYNHDVSLNILSSPFDANNGRHEATVTLTPGKYRYFCSIPGHGTMTGEFTVGEAGPDTTPPTVTAAVTGPQNPAGEYVGSASVALTATDGESGVDTVEYKLDSGAWTPYTAPVTVSTLGAHMVHYRATDVAGNVSAEGMSSFTVVEDQGEDTTPPTVTAAVTGTQDGDGNYVDTATVTVTATDAGSGVDTVEYKLDAGAWTAYTAPVAVTAAGAHTVLYRATDKAGNASTEGTVTFAVVKSSGDIVPPTTSVGLAGTQNGDWAYVGSVTVTVSAADTARGVLTPSRSWCPRSARTR